MTATSHTDNASEPAAPREGLTKREYFAAAALQGLLAHHNNRAYEAVVRDAVVYADDLLQELAK